MKKNPESCNWFFVLTFVTKQRTTPLKLYWEIEKKYSEWIFRFKSIDSINNGK